MKIFASIPERLLMERLLEECRLTPTKLAFIYEDIPKIVISEAENKKAELDRTSVPGQVKWNPKKAFDTEMELSSQTMEYLKSALSGMEFSLMEYAIVKSLTDKLDGKASDVSASQ